MDIFVIEIIDADEVHLELLKEFQKKEISDPKAWNTHCLSYLMVDRVLREFYKIENREVVFEGKKPVLKSKEKHFSISHSGDYIALAFSDYNCGIDIEKNTERNFEAIANRMKLEASSPEEFYKKWTQFEAKYKLNDTVASEKNYQLADYTITAVSSNPNETYEIYLQTNN